MVAENKRTCPSCGGVMKHESRTDNVTYKGHTRSFETTGWWCTSCDEAIFEGPELEKAEKAFIELRAEVEQVLRPEEVAVIRTRLKLSQREAGKLLGGGPRAFQKYESGSVPVSTPMNNLLVLLGRDPKRLKELQRHERITRTQERVVGQAVANKRDEELAKIVQDQERTPELQRIRKGSAKVGIGKSSTRIKAGFNKAAKSKARGNRRSSTSAAR